MYVKSLSLKGFKSFADPVTLDLQPGVNVVVGPNGSGKSNVIDAVAWVLGAQGAKTVRGGKMDDVIFAGSGKRSALGRAEVSLTIDNSDGKVPLDFSEVTITRTLFRTGESEYAINGVSCRLLDIQEMLSDSGVGRQQHVIVSQGNLDAVLAARPEDRRMIIEEAAGVLKHRKRREKSQRRLEGTESNLERLADLVREVRQQMRPLEKQAAAARRHEDVASELRALRLYIAGRDVSRLREKRDAADKEAEELKQTDQRLRRDLTDADEEVRKAEQELAELGNDDTGENVERLEGSYQRGRGIANVLVQRRRTLESELASSVSKDVVASLEHDAETTRRDIAAVEGERASIEPRFDELQRAEGSLANEWLNFESEWGEGLPLADNKAPEIRGEANALRNSVGNQQQESERRSRRLESLRHAAEDSRNQQAQAKSTVDECRERLDGLTSRISETEQHRSEQSSAVESTQGELREAEQVLYSAKARVDALTSALDATRARAGVDNLAGIDGVSGTLMDLVDIDDGYEAAFEAAVGEALAAVVVASNEVARRALSQLREGNTEGAVISLETGHGAPPQGGDDGDGLRSHVRGSSDAVNALLDHLVAGCVVVHEGWEEALARAARHGWGTVVTPSGDRFGNTGWRVGTGRNGATSAALQQAQELTASAQTDVDRLAQEFRSAKDQLSESERQLKELSQQQRQTEAALANSENAIERHASVMQKSETEASDLETDIRDGHQRLETDQQRLAELDEQLPALEAAEASGVERAQRWKSARSVLEERSSVLRRERSEVDLRASSLDERHQFLSQRLESLTERLQRHRVELEQAAQRREGIEASLRAIDAMTNFVRQTIARIESALVVARRTRDEQRQARNAANERMRSAGHWRSRTERELTSTTERLQQHEVGQAEIRVRLETLETSLQDELQVDVDTAIAAPTPELPEGQTAKQRAGELDKELKQMGPINPLALEELEQVQERHKFLDEQLQDVQNSRKELIGVIKAVDAEIVEVFRLAFDDVAANFKQLFETLFPGGTGKLTLTDPENLLETGIEIEAKPSGKNVRTLSLLSGGERSLAAMAFLFAVFRSRPSPFYLLDEVEAALDDMNLSRFLTLLDEFRNDAQLVVVSHQKRTMEKADCLYGVSMQTGGSSKVVSERVHVDLIEAPEAAAV